MDLPAIKTVADLPKAVVALLLGVTGRRERQVLWQRWSGEAGKALEFHDIEERLRRLEEVQALNQWWARVSGFGPERAVAVRG